MRSFLKHAAKAASADSRIASQHAHHHGAGTEMALHEIQAHRPQPAHHSSSQFSQSHAYQQTTTTSQQQLQQQSYQQSNQSSYGAPIQYNNDCNPQQQQGYQRSFQPHGAPNQYNDNNAIYQQQSNQKAQTAAANRHALDNTLFTAQLSAAAAPQPPYNVQDTTENPLPPVGSYTDPNVDVTGPDYNPSGEGTVDRQDYGSAAAYQPASTADPSISATQGNQTTFDQFQPQPMMNISASSVPGDEDVGYQTASAMNTTTSAPPDQTTINDNCCNNDDGGCFTCLSECCCSNCC